ncbi:MAG: hypothetical protein DWB56_08235 [Candidatus Jettenia sp.]|nr:MAG: hypothetical protein EDM77_03185 [Candidatus Jettenia sp. AMX1]MBC6928934.1 hypothetical protein [Candidatus Jettenia sp.]MCE7879935.1 hypothetical protein [Candidatus Jettenia sp. AMX1]MCQ3926715.1 hypothetical protein [Candidatus Jettenia sp.]
MRVVEKRGKYMSVLEKGTWEVLPKGKQGIVHPLSSFLNKKNTLIFLFSQHLYIFPPFLKGN